MPPISAPTTGIGIRISPTIAPEIDPPTDDVVPSATFPAYFIFVDRSAVLFWYSYNVVYPSPPAIMSVPKRGTAPIIQLILPPTTALLPKSCTNWPALSYLLIFAKQEPKEEPSWPAAVLTRANYCLLRIEAACYCSTLEMQDSRPLVSKPLEISPTFSSSIFQPYIFH